MFVIEEVAIFFQRGGSVFVFDFALQRREDAGLNVSEGWKKIKKRVLFFEQFCIEEEVEKFVGLVEEDLSNFRELICEGVVVGNGVVGQFVEFFYIEGFEREVVIEFQLLSYSVLVFVVGCFVFFFREESFLEGFFSDGSLEEDSLFVRVGGDDIFMV